MTVPLLPGPDAGADDQRQKNENQRQQADRDDHDPHSRGPDEPPHIANEEECLAVLSRLPALVALGILTTSKANTIRSTYTAILQHYRQKRSGDDRGGVAGDALVDMLSRHPELANLLEPLLSQAQIAAIMARAKDG